jgi:hypothetical protein
MKKLLFCCCFFIQSLIFSSSLFAQEKVLFKFNHQKDDASSYVSIVEEDVYYNGYLSHHAQIVNRISSVINDVSEDGTADVTANYMTTEDSVSNFTKKALVEIESIISMYMIEAKKLYPNKDKISSVLK